jgi:GNAT superfamily N-acetyltransferase
LARKILKAKPEDAAALQQIWWEAKDEIPLTRTDALDQRISEWKSFATDRTVFKLVDGGDIRALMLILGDEIRYIVVKKDYRRRGAATLLLSYAKRRVQGREKPRLFVETKESNMGMRAILEVAGFRRITQYANDWLLYEWHARTLAPKHRHLSA